MHLKIQYETDKEKIISGRVSKDIRGNKLFGCDVCWTCKWFDIDYKACRPFHYLIQPPTRTINHPEAYRCSFWSVR